MAEPARPCSCTTYTLLCYCGPQNGISVVQPNCQSLPDGSVVNNPAYVPLLNKSFWTYKFLTDGNSTTRAISNFGIPVCESITATNLVVSEKIDGCGTYAPVPFTLTRDDPNLGPAPAGFQYVKVETGGRFDKGVSVEYRLEILGDFPTTTQPIKVKAGPSVLTFDCGCFLVPQCPPHGQLTMTKNCVEKFSNNQVTLDYNLVVANIGNASLSNVQFFDTITLPVALSPGPITVTPATLNVDTGVPGQIKISGSLGTINQGGQVGISYVIPVLGVTEPGRYIINNTALASAEGTQATATSSVNVKAVRLATDKCCSVTDADKGTFRFTIASVGLSPDISVNVVDDIFIPGGITVQFTNFDGCLATFANTGTPVPLNTDVAGPRRIRIDCNNLLIPTGNVARKNISFKLVSSSAPGIAAIENAVQSVTPVKPDEQIYLGAGVLPAQADMQVQLSMSSTKPCI